MDIEVRSGIGGSEAFGDVVVGAGQFEFVRGPPSEKRGRGQREGRNGGIRRC